MTALPLALGGVQELSAAPLGDGKASAFGGGGHRGPLGFREADWERAPAGLVESWSTDGRHDAHHIGIRKNLPTGDLLVYDKAMTTTSDTDRPFSTEPPLWATWNKIHTNKRCSVRRVSQGGRTLSQPVTAWSMDYILEHKAADLCKRCGADKLAGAR